MTEATSAAATSPSPFAGGDWFDPLEEAVRRRVRAFIEELLEEELEAALGRGRYGRDGAAKGHRHGRRPRRLVTSFGPLELTVPRARLRDAAGEGEGRSELLPAYRRLSRRAEALVAQAYLAGANTRRVRRALAGLFAGRVGKDAVSRAWRRARSAWEAWRERDLAGEDVVRLILDGTAVKVRLDKRATAISLSWSRSASAATARRWCSRSRTGAARARPPGARCWRAWPRAAWASPSSRSSTAARGSRPRSPPCGTTCPSSAARCTRSATCWRTRPSTCTRRSRPTSTTWCTPRARPRCWPSARRSSPSG